MNVVLLLFAVMLGTGRSVFSKRMISGKNGKKSFYFNQFLLFLSGLVSIFACNIKAFSTVTAKTFFYGAIFGIVTIIAQWCYTVALSMGPTSICAMVYSFGFIFPTVSGAIFWNEPFGVTTLIGLIIAVSAIIASSFSDKKENKKNIGFIIPNLIAMAASGGLGILQKLHQESADKHNLDGFLVIAFMLATIISLIMTLVSKAEDTKKPKFNIFPILAGACFGIVSLVNTLLAGRMKSAILFPTLNIGVMMACLISGIIIFKEKPTKPQLIAFGLGIAAILVLSI